MKNFNKYVFYVLASALLLTVFAGARGTAVPWRVEWNFGKPTALLIDPSGALLVADSQQNNVVTLDANGHAARFAGLTLPSAADGKPVGGHVDTAAEDALFQSPVGLTHWLGGVVVSDRQNHSLRLITDGKVRTLSGTGKPGKQDGPAALATFNAPIGVAVGDDGRLYVADSGNGCIRAITDQGQVSTYVSGLHQPAGMAWYDGALYVTDVGSHRILRIQNAVVTPVAGASAADGAAWVGGFADGPAASAQFSAPLGIAVDKSGIYVADTGNSAIRVLRDGWVRTMAYYAGSEDSLWPASPAGLALQGGTLYCADQFAGCILRMETEATLFADVPRGSWYEQAVSYAVTGDLLRSSSQTDFSPNAPVTRGTLDATVRRLAALPPVTADTGFSEQTVTRQQLATTLWEDARRRQLVWKSDDLRAFSDAGHIAPDALEAMRFAVGSGLFVGCEGRLRPRDALTRAELAVTLTRYCTTQIPAPETAGK